MRDSSPTKRAAAAGYLAGAAVEFGLYPIGSYKCQCQAGGAVRFPLLTRGMLALPFLGIAPSLGLFFAIYTPLKQSLEGPLPGIGVVAASVCAACPASAARIPADVVQKRLVLGLPGCESSVSTVATILKQSGARGFFTGWRANLISDVPFAAVKMFLFEGMAWFYTRLFVPGNPQTLSQLEVAGIGMVSGATTAVATCPIDVINTHLKAGLVQERSILATGTMIVNKHGVRALFRGATPRMVATAIGGGVFWPLHAWLKERINL